jgi:hypothetical protein
MESVRGMRNENVELGRRRVGCLQQGGEVYPDSSQSRTVGRRQCCGRPECAERQGSSRQRGPVLRDGGPRRGARHGPVGFGPGMLTCEANRLLKCYRPGLGCMRVPPPCVLAIFTFEPDVYDHSKELQEVVDSRVSEEDAFTGDLYSPRFPRSQAVSTNAKGARVRPADSRRLSNSD